MKKEKLYKSPYVITSVLVCFCFSLIFISKGIFPFGKNSLIWGDMHDQITAFYYHFYDSFRGNASLLVDFTTGGGVNFLGIMAYYILSPLTFLLLFFPREQVYLAVSIIVALKILISSLTCLYFIRYYFKKLPNAISIFLAICYAFSGYSLFMYQITPWMDAMYLFPLVMIGLKKTLDLEKPTWYIITLTISLICSFYVSIMIVIFIFLASYIYLLTYKEKKERKKAILSLGISTILSLLMAAFIIIPSYMEISISSRMGFNLGSVLNSRSGPLTDKLSFFMFGGVLYLGILLLLKNHKKEKKFLIWYFATSLIVLIPAIVEPINKIWHFGSYAYFPYRFAFITMFLLIVGACQGYNIALPEKLKKIKKENDLMKNIILVIGTILSSIVIILLTYRYYGIFQNALNKLTLSINQRTLLLLGATTFIDFVCCMIIYHFTSSWKKVRIGCMLVITIVHILCNGFLYLGIDKTQKDLMGQYESSLEVSKSYQEKDYYRVKNLVPYFMMNSGMSMKYHTLDHFTSLTSEKALKSLKKMGYSSMWVKTSSKGGTLFSDALLANKYIISEEKIDSPYYKQTGKYKSLYFYELKEELSYGYFMNENETIFDKKNSFEVQNSIYKKITNTSKNLFTTYEDWKKVNIKESKKENNKTLYESDKNRFCFLEQNIKVNGNKILYLEILNDLDNSTNQSIYEKFNIYINDKLYKEHALTENDNGIIELGMFKDEEVNIKVEVIYDVELEVITLGAMDVEKYEGFMKNEKVPTTVEYNRNKVKVQVDSDKKQLLFLPISYNGGYIGTNNGKKIEVQRVFGNFIGIPVEEGENSIELKFIPAGLKEIGLISVISLIITVILLKKDYYFKIINFEVLGSIVSVIYKIIYALLIIFVYIGLTITFILSYFAYFNI